MAKFAGTLVLFFGFTAGCCDLRFGTGCCGYFRKGPASHPSAFLSPTSVETCGYIIARESMLIATRLPLPFMRLYTCGISSFCNPLKQEKMWWTVAKLLTDRVVVKKSLWQSIVFSRSSTSYMAGPLVTKCFPTASPHPSQNSVENTWSCIAKWHGQTNDIDTPTHWFQKKKMEDTTRQGHIDDKYLT